MSSFRMNNVPALQGGVAGGQGAAAERPRSPFNIVNAMMKEQIGNQAVVRMLQHGFFDRPVPVPVPSPPKPWLTGWVGQQWTTQRLGLSDAAKQYEADCKRIKAAKEWAARGGMGPSSATSGSLGGQSIGEGEAKPINKPLKRVRDGERRMQLAAEKSHIARELPGASGPKKQELLERNRSIEIEDAIIANRQAMNGPMSKAEFAQHFRPPTNDVEFRQQYVPPILSRPFRRGVEAARARNASVRRDFERKYKAFRLSLLPATTTVTSSTTTTSTTTMVSTVQDTTLPPSWPIQQEEEDILYTPGEEKYVYLYSIA